MNLCTKCKSYYEKPGTCNCFAEKPVTVPTQNPAPMWVSPQWIYHPFPGTLYPYPTRWEITCSSTTSAGITEHPNNPTVNYANVDVTYT